MRQNVQPTTCGLTDKTGLSQCAEANSGSKDDSKDCQSCCVHSMDCSGTGDSSSIDSQCCKNRNHRAIGMQYYDKDCSECQIVRRDPTPDELTMCLHALSYKVSASKWLLLCACIIKLTPNSNDTILCVSNLIRCLYSLPFYYDIIDKENLNGFFSKLMESNTHCHFPSLHNS